MSKIIGAVVIYLDQSYTQREDIGLYTSGSDDSEIRWSETPLTGFCHTMLLKNGIGAISESFDETNGGNITTVGDFTFSIHGAMQLLLRMKSLSIQLSGKYVEYIEYVDGTPEVVGSFTIEDTGGNEFEERITAKTAFQLRRNKLLATRLSSIEYPNVVDELKDGTAPVTFGQSNPSNGVFFKLPRIEFKNVALTTSEILAPFASARPADMTLFPVRDTDTDSLHADVIFGSAVGPAHSLAGLLGKYLKVVSGSEVSGQINIDGEIRKIATAPRTQGDGDYRTDKWVALTFSQYFSEILPGIDGTTYHAFVQIIDSLLRYALDTVSSECFTSDLSEFHTRESETMVRVMGVGVVKGTAGLPVFDLEPPVSSSTVGEIGSFAILPVVTVEPLVAYDYDNVVINNLDRFGVSNCRHIMDGAEVIPGVFAVLGSGTLCPDNVTVTGDEGAYNDRDSTTWREYSMRMTTVHPVDYFDYYVAFKITLPKIDSTVIFDKVYLGIIATSNCTDDSTDPELLIGSRFVVARRKHYGNSTNPVDNSDIRFKDPVRFDSLPDDYFSDTPTTNNKAFYYAENVAARLTGYRNFDLDISTVEEYNNIEECVIILKRWGQQVGIASYINDVIRIYEVAIIFEKSITLGSEIYA